MKKIRLLAALGMLLFFISIMWAGLASAHSFHTGDTVILGGGQPINQTVFAAGKTVSIDSEVYGDVICAGQTVTISGTVHGDVICAGQTVNVSGVVDGDVRLAGQTTTLSAAVSGNATIGSQTFTLESGGKVGGDMSVGSTDTTLIGNIGRDLAIASKTAVISGTVGRDIKGTTTQLSLLDGARVAGNIDFTSNNGLDKATGAMVGGTVTHHLPSHQTKSKHGAVWGFGFGWFLYCLVAMVFLGIILTLLFPRWLHATTGRVTPWSWNALWVGLLANMGLPVLVGIVAMTVIGIPLAVLIMLFWFALTILSAPFFAYYIGRLVLRKSRKPLLIMLVGMVITTVVFFIPVVGCLVALASLFIGSGMLLMQLAHHTPKPSYTV